VNLEWIKKLEKKTYIYIYFFIFIDLIVFLVKSDRNIILKKIFIILNVKDDPKIFCEAISSRDVIF
jgi:hypothetical protein